MEIKTAFQIGTKISRKYRLRTEKWEWLYAGEFIILKYF